MKKILPLCKLNVNIPGRFALNWILTRNIFLDEVKKSKQHSLYEWYKIGTLNPDHIYLKDVKTLAE
jgi:hypothetical protein